MNWIKKQTTKYLQYVLDRAPDDTATHVQNGNYTRVEGKKYRYYQTKKPCINGDGHDCEYWDCNKAMWERYTNGFAEDAGISLLDIKNEIISRSHSRFEILRDVDIPPCTIILER